MCVQMKNKAIQEIKAQAYNEHKYSPIPASYV